MTLSDFSPNVHGLFHLLKVAVWTFFSYWTYYGRFDFDFQGVLWKERPASPSLITAANSTVVSKLSYSFMLRLRQIDLLLHIMVIDCPYSCICMCKQKNFTQYFCQFF